MAYSNNSAKVDRQVKKQIQILAIIELILIEKYG